MNRSLNLFEDYLKPNNYINISNIKVVNYLIILKIEYGFLLIIKIRSRWIIKLWINDKLNLIYIINSNNIINKIIQF